MGGDGIPASQLMDALRTAIDQRDANPSKEAQAHVLECLIRISTQIGQACPEVGDVTSGLQQQLTDLNNEDPG